MADALDATVEVSLGQLAVAQGVLTAAQRDHLGVELVRRATAKRPTSMARLLIQAGLTAPQVQALLTRGAHFPAVRCDACELSIPQGQLRRREELPCPRCGSLVLGFAVYAAPPGEGSAADDESTSVGPTPEALDETERWRTVLPVPGAAREGGATDRWPGVLPLPRDRGDDTNDRTIAFAGVLAAPGDGTVDLPPGAASADEADVERTIAFGDVFLLPGRSDPRPDREVSEEMLTLMAPQGFSALAEAEPASLTPPDFDPGAVTAPMAKDEIQAMLRKGPPPQTRAPKPAAPPPATSSASSGPALPPLPTLEPVTPAPPAKTKTDRRKRPPKPPASSRRWPLVLVALVVLVALAAGGAYAAFRYGWLGV